ncbi:hypothetical protein HWD03_gp119 [Alteromonas phage vB_AmeM_PT11-V22]|uniref:Uncharacterized protein n=1 Tax=Alteromonas phage vB_AmeM_PT11-V22 TaxID=2704031 RepID=A0A6C0R0S4_9CAUD|nr:hypothetical protein HWD03_gp119 [Alteromonas phage vB_AmeM_PT11-V22]QHZ59850.1 hypothetical protein [Alteromonas phage vB_AmeM_PT11-V22]
MKIHDAKVTITIDDPHELFYPMSREEVLAFYEALACRDEVIEYVMQQVFEGYTQDNFCHGSIGCSWNGSTPLQAFRKKMIEVGASIQAKMRIEELERALESKDLRIEQLQDEVYKLKGIDVGENNIWRG